MASTERKYSNISFTTIRDHLLTILRAKGGKLADYSESSYGRLMVETFAGHADLMANYTESAFENSWLESAYNDSAIYSGARMLGYSVRRPMPGKARLGLQLTTTGHYDTVRVHIPRGTMFQLDNIVLTAMDELEYGYDRDNDPQLTGMMTLLSGTPVIAEGYFTERTFVSTGEQNQTYYIDDETFSDYFGEGDPNYADDGNIAQRASAFTTVSSDATLMDNIDRSVVVGDRLYWRISRRGLADPARSNNVNDLDDFASGQSNYTNNYSVEISTSNDGNVMLKFGDGVKSAIPYGVVRVKYFSTSGESGNLMNVAGTVIKPKTSNILITQADGSESDISVDDLNFAITTNISGGLPIESIDSIKNSAPGIFNSLDRLVNRASYKIFLQRYANVKYATAYGEDILNTRLPNGGIDVKYMNQIRFSVLKDLYRESDGKYYPTTPDEYYIQGCKINGLLNTWEYDFQELQSSAYDGTMDTLVRTLRNTLIDTASDDSNPFHGSDDVTTSVNEFMSNYVIPLMPTYPLNYRVFSSNMTPLDYVVDNSELATVMTALNRRAMLTVGSGYHTYVYPTVHEVEVSMDITLYKGHNFTDIKEKVKNLIYKYMRANTEFSTAIYRSKLESIVHQLVEVAGVNVSFAPVDDKYSTLDIATLPWLGENTAEHIVPGDIGATAFNYYISFDADMNALATDNSVIECTIPDQSPMTSRLADYYKYEILPKIDALSDYDIEKYSAYIWDQVMQQIYTPLVEKWKDARASGDLDEAAFYYKIAQNMKNWDMDTASIRFKDSDVIKDMREVKGSSLFDYMHYGIEYIKLVRHVLGYHAAKNLIDADGNITGYSSENEIVQLNIPTENITLTVSTESSLLTE